MPDKSELLQQLKLDKSSNPPSQSGWTGRLSLIILGMLVGAGVVYFSGFSSGSQSSMPSSTPTAAQNKAIDSPGSPQVTTPPASNISKILDASGYITARQTATVSAKVMGLILSVEVDEGMQVEKGQVLARIDDTQARISLESIRAQQSAQVARVQRLQAQLAEAERVLARVTNLTHAGQFSSESQLSKAQTDVASLKAELVSAAADVEVAEKNVSYQQSIVNDYIIRAPFAGVVTAKNAQAGEIVSPSSAGGGFTRTGICTIVDMNSLEIEVDVNEAYIGRVYQGQKVEAVLDAYPDWAIPASVIAVIPTADRAKATVRVRIQIDIKDTKILPDMGVKVSFFK